MFKTVAPKHRFEGGSILVNTKGGRLQHYTRITFLNLFNISSLQLSVDGTRLPCHITQGVGWMCCLEVVNLPNAKASPALPSSHDGTAPLLLSVVVTEAAAAPCDFTERGGVTTTCWRGTTRTRRSAEGGPAIQSTFVTSGAVSVHAV